VDSKFVKIHQPCWCGDSSDSTGINSDGSAYCFTCNKRTPNYSAGKGDSVTETIQKPTQIEAFTDRTPVTAAIPDRKLSEAVCRKYGVKVISDSKGITDHLYPYYDDNNKQVATKTRKVADKKFYFQGRFNESGMFGRNLFKSGGKYLTITEGELDAMSVHQMNGLKWAAVSVGNGAAGAAKSIKKEIEYIESFDNVVLCFDSDKPGQDAAREVAKLIKPGKCKIMKLPEGYKDANDMLVSNKSAAFIQAFWDAEDYMPSGILNLTAQKLDFFKIESVETVPYPWEGLNEMLSGLRLKELVTLTGGTGLGKSSVTREIEHHLLTTTKDKIGIMALEEDWRRTTMGIVSIEAECRLFIDKVREEYPKEKLQEHYENLFERDNRDRMYVHAHLGIQSIDDIFAKLRYLIVGCDCKWIVLDHLHMLLHDTGSDERKAIDDAMMRLRSLVEETGCGMILVSHLRRTGSDTGHEQGLEVSLSHLRGSQSIAQLSDTVIALERNQQATSKEEANRTVLRVLKSRHTGETGIACTLSYNRDTGRLLEVEEDDEFTLQGVKHGFD